MPENVYKCFFSKGECRSCPVYRGKHSYIITKDGDETPRARIVKNVDIDWQKSLKEALHNEEEHVFGTQEALTSTPQKINTDNHEREEKEYRISLRVLDKETGGRRVCTVMEASTWDWGNRQKVRSIGAWHIYSFERLLSVLAHKAEAGCEEVELIEAPFYMGC
jgi:hypothetical protein